MKNAKCHLLQLLLIPKGQLGKQEILRASIPNSPFTGDKTSQLLAGLPEAAQPYQPPEQTVVFCARCQFLQGVPSGLTRPFCQLHCCGWDSPSEHTS